MKTFDEWFLEQNERVVRDLYVSAEEILRHVNLMKVKYIKAEEDVLFFMMGASLEFEEMSYYQCIEFIDNTMKKYKKEYYEEYRQLKVIRGGK